MAGITRKFSIAPISMDAQTLSHVTNLANSALYTILSPIHHYAADSNDMLLLENLRRDPPDIFMVDFDTNEERAKRTVAQIRQVLPACVIFAVASSSTPEKIVAAMRAGCAEYLIKPLTTSKFQEALMDFEAARVQLATPIRKGRIASLLGVKGGVGVTSLAVHLATFTARLNGGRTLLIDQHPDLGDVCVYLGLTQDRHRYHFYELVANLHRLDRELLDGFVLRHESGLEVLTSPDAFDSMKISPSNIEGALERLRSFYEVIILDCAHGLPGFNVSAVEKSDRVCLITTPEFPSVRNLARYLDYLVRFNCPDDKIEIILNRDSKRNAIHRSDVEKAIKRSVTRFIPNDYDDVIEAINSGRPLLPSADTDLVRNLKIWAESLVGSSEPAKAPAKKRFGILGI